jgi:hypothetical protein
LVQHFERIVAAMHFGLLQYASSVLGSFYVLLSTARIEWSIYLLQYYVEYMHEGL